MKLSEFYPEMEGAEPVEPVAKSPQFPNQQTETSPYLRAPLPLPLQYSPDTLRQTNRPGFSVFRTSITAPAGLAALVSSVQSTATAAASSGSLGIINLSVPSIFTPITQTQSESPYNLLFELTPEPAGTFLAGAPISIIDVVDKIATMQGSSSDPYVLTSSTSAVAEFGLLFVASQGGGPTIPAPGAGWTQLGATGTFTTVYTQFYSAVSTISINQPSAGFPFAGILVLFGTTGVSPAPAQPFVQGSGAGPTSVSTSNFSLSNTAGNTIVVLVSCDNVLAPIDGVVTDTLGNTYVKLINIGSLPSTPSNNQAIMYVATNIKAGTPNAVNFAGTGTGAVTVTAIEYNNISKIVGVPTFRAIQSSDISGVAVTSLQGETGDVVLTSSDSSVTITTPTADTINLVASGAAFNGGVNSQTANYTILGTDSQKIVSLASGSHTFKLPAAITSTKFVVFVENVGSGTLTLDPNGLTLDASASTVTIGQNQGMYIATDGTNYFSSRGMGGGGSSAFSSITSGTNTTAAMLLGSGSSLGTTGSGTNAATSVGGITVTGTPSSGQVLTATSSSAADWQTPGGGGGGTAFQSLQRHAVFMADGSTTTPEIVGEVLQLTFVGSTSAALPTASKGPVVIYPPSGASQLFISSLLVGGGINFNGGHSGNYVTGRNVKVQWKGYWSAAASGDLWLAMFTGSNTGNDALGIGRASDPSVTAQVSGAGFRNFNTTLGETTWMAYSGNGVAGASTVVNTTVTQDTAEHTFAIIFNDATPSITYYIDGTLVATITTHLPASAAPMAMMISAHSATSSWGFGSCYIDSDI